MTKLHINSLTIPGVQLGEENPLPFFRHPAISREIQVRSPFPQDKRLHLGWETTFRVLPYRMQDQYNRQKEPLAFKCLVLENEHLRASFLPELGGRLISLVYKPLERELLHRNPVFQPANLAIRNAWFSGGIEWNIGQFGHTFHTCSPVFAAEIRGAQGEPGLRLYEFERCKRLFWQIDFYLPPGLPFLLAYTRVINPNEEPAAMYWWTNIAVDERPGLRVLAPAESAIYASFEAHGIAFGLTGLPGLPSLDGQDGTYPLNSTFANEFFFQCDSSLMPWEAALDETGSGLVEASTSRLKYRKLFCWGTHAGGRHWQEFLAREGEAYLEIQAGLAPTQVHGLPMPGQTAWDWTQAFGFLQADPARAHSAAWDEAWGEVQQALHVRLSPQKLNNLEESYRGLADQTPRAMLQNGAGWGALELRRRAKEGGAFTPPPAFAFPLETLGAEQHKWLELLERGRLPEPDPNELPGEWMVQPEWEHLVKASLEHPAGRNWFALLHLGVMRLERFDEVGALAAWEESLRLQPSAWAARNLAVLCLRQGQYEEATRYYDLAWKQATLRGAPPLALTIEVLQTMLERGQLERAWQAYQMLPQQAQEADRIQILRGQIALALDDLAAVEQVLERDYAVVREGETILTDLWFELHARKEARRTGQPLDEALRRRVQETVPPPRRIDFRSSNA